MKTVKVTRLMALRAARRINWARVDAMTDYAIARQVAGNPDAAPLPVGRDDPGLVQRRQRRAMKKAIP